MKTNILKSMIRTILGVFLLAAAVMFNSGIAPNEKVQQETESLNAQSTESVFAVEIGGQCAPRSLGAGLAFTPIGGTEVSKSKLPSAQIATTADFGDAVASSFDIGGQSAPRGSSALLAFWSPIGGTEMPKPNLPRVLVATIANAEDLKMNKASSFDIGGTQSVPRSPSGGHAICTAIGGTEMPKSKLPSAQRVSIFGCSEDQTNAGVAGFDIGGPQTPPRGVSRPWVANNCLTKNTVHEHS